MFFKKATSYDPPVIFHDVEVGQIPWIKKPVIFLLSGILLFQHSFNVPRIKIELKKSELS